MVRKIMLAAMLLLVLVASLIAAEMTADDLIAKYFAATGGEQSLRALKSMSIKGTAFGQGMSMDLKASYVLPNKMYMENGMNGIVMNATATNGKDAWVVVPMLNSSYSITGDDKESIAEQANRFPLLDYKKAGGTAKLIGEDLVKGAKAFKLQYVGPSKDTTIYYFDATTYLPVKEKRGEAVVSYSDYRKTGGLTLPHKISVQAGAQTSMMTVDTIIVNQPIADSLFVMPKDVKPYDSLKALQQRMQGGGGGK
jgi:zinc protease